jgi:hypothetical protein
LPTYEDRKEMKPDSLDLERARQSLIEELQAMDWYQERIDASKSASLKKVLAHNRDEEKEHAAMLLEWINANDPVQAKKFMEHD